MQHIFLSDVHLGALRPDQNKKLENELIELIRHCSENGIKIHVLGDLFDYWMEFPEYTPPLGNKLFAQFRRHHKTNKKSTFITGNHDCWTRNHFEESGFNVVQESAVLDIDGATVLMLHGDGLADKSMNFPRPVLNRVLRNSTFVSAFQSIFSGETGNHLMKTFSELTRDEHDLDPNRISRWANEVLKNHVYDYIISGHDHIPRIETFSGGTYINAGAYYLYKTVVLYNNEQFKLVIWNSADRTFKPMEKTSK